MSILCVLCVVCVYMCSVYVQCIYTYIHICAVYVCVYIMCSEKGSRGWSAVKRLESGPQEPLEAALKQCNAIDTIMQCNGMQSESLEE